MTKSAKLRQEWHTRIGEYRASGLTLKAWCAVNGCTVDQMKYWLYKSAKCTSPSPTSSPDAAPKARFIPLALADEAKNSSLTLRVGSVQIELHAGFDARLLRDVVQALTEPMPC